MNGSYPDGIMLCFVQGFGEGEHGYNKNREFDCNVSDPNLKYRKRGKRVSLQLEEIEETEHLESKPKQLQGLIAGKNLRLTSGTRLPEVKRSFSDRFSVITDPTARKSGKNLQTIRKTWSTGNFAGAAGGGCGAPRSAPASPLQLEPPLTRPKHDKQAIKPLQLSGSAPSMRESSLALGDEAKEVKQPSKARQKKFQRHFPQVGPEEKVLNYYSCALVGDLLLQGHLYITKNYFAFYSNVFGYVTKLLIPTTSVLRITKEKVARIIPNAVGVCTRDERHVFGSLLSRDSTYKLMTYVWKTARAPELTQPSKSQQELRASEVELDASEYSPEDDSSSAGGDRLDPPEPVRREPDTLIATGGAAVIQPVLLTGSSAPKPRASHWHVVLVALALILACTGSWLGYRLYLAKMQPLEEVSRLSGAQAYSEAVRWRSRLHARAAADLHSFLATNLVLLTKVRQSLEALSGVILTDVTQNPSQINVNVPADPVFS